MTPAAAAAEDTDRGEDSAHRIEYLPVRQIKSAAVNPKSHDIPRLRESIERFGFGPALLRDERTGKLVAGHGRLATVTQMERDGAERPEGIVAAESGEWMLPVQHGWRSKNDDEARAYLLADNILAERGGWNDLELAEMVREMSKRDEELLHAAGLDDRDVRRLLAQLNTVPPTAPDQFPPLEPQAVFAHTCPRCGLGFDE